LTRLLLVYFETNIFNVHGTIHSHWQVVCFEKLFDPGLVLHSCSHFSVFLATFNLVFDSFLFYVWVQKLTVALHVVVGATFVSELFATAILAEDSLLPGMVVSSMDFDRVLGDATVATLFWALKRQPCKDTQV